MKTEETLRGRERALLAKLEELGGMPGDPPWVQQQRARLGARLAHVRRALFELHQLALRFDAQPVVKRPEL